MRRCSRHSAGTTKHFWDGGNIAVEKTGSTITEYHRGLTLIYYKQGNTVRYYLFNGHGDVVKLTTDTGVVVKTYVYDAFGEEQDIIDSDSNHFRYCGEYYDKETKTLYLRARYYSSATGRFTQEDPIKDGRNWYAYCANNPVNLADPSGLKVMLQKDEGGGNCPYEETATETTPNASETTASETVVEVPDVYFTNKGGLSKKDIDTLAKACKNSSGASLTKKDTNFTSAKSIDVEQPKVACVHNNSVFTTPMFDFIFVAGEAGEQVSSSIVSGNLDNPVTLVVEESDEWFSLTDSKIGVNVNIGNGGYSLSVGVLEVTSSLGFGDFSIEMTGGWDRISLRINEGVSWKNKTATSYQEYYIRTVPTVLATVAVACGGPVAVYFLAQYLANNPQNSAFSY